MKRIPYAAYVPLLWGASVAQAQVPQFDAVGHLVLDEGVTRWGFEGDPLWPVVGLEADGIPPAVAGESIEAPLQGRPGACRTFSS